MLQNLRHNFLYLCVTIANREAEEKMQDTSFIPFGKFIQGVRSGKGSVARVEQDLLRIIELLLKIILALVIKG